MNRVHQMWIHPTKFISDLLISRSAVGGIESDKERSLMAKKLYKCFACGRIYEDEQSAGKCHNAPIQMLVKDESRPKPRFLGN